MSRRDYRSNRNDPHNLTALLPLIKKLTKQEIACILKAFKLYDYHGTGKIPSHLARKLINSLGLSVPSSDDGGGGVSLSSSETTLHELLLIVDKLMPEPEPLLISSLESFSSFASMRQEILLDSDSNSNNNNNISGNAITNTESNGAAVSSSKEKAMSRKVINPTSVAKFMESLGRPPININEASLMLNAMLEYDDCAEIPIVDIEVFNKEVINFAKKTNAFKDYRG
jgi:hypothetical protein